MQSGAGGMSMRNRMILLELNEVPLECTGRFGATPRSNRSPQKYPLGCECAVHVRGAGAL